MSAHEILIISDIDNRNYWFTVTDEIKKKIGPVDVMLDRDISTRRLQHPYHVIVMDISDLEELKRMILEIHDEQPKSRIVIVSSSPTWKLTREVIKQGATTLIRKTSNLDEVISEIQAL